MRRAAGIAALACASCAQLPGPSEPAATLASSRAPATAAPEVALAVAPMPTPTARPPAEFGWLGDLVGSCWLGERPGGEAADTQCYMLQFDRVIRSGVKGPNFDAEAVFGIGLGSSRPVYTQWTSMGYFSTGDVTIEGETLVFVNRFADGTAVDSRAVWRRTGPDSYRVTRERKDDSGGWKEYAVVEYHRAR